MIITRKLLIPTITFFALVLIGLLGVRLYYDMRSQEQAEEKSVEQLSQTFFNRLDSLEALMLALSIEAAGNPAIQEAFANENRFNLTELTLPVYRSIQERFGISEHHYYKSPATSFLRLHQIGQYGEDFSTYRSLVLQVNAERRPLSGLEIGQQGLTVYGIAPVRYQTRFAGMVEFGQDINQTLLDDLKEQYGVDWQIIIRKDAAEKAGYTGSQGGATASPSSDLMLAASTLPTPFFAEATVYYRALNGRQTISRITAHESNYTILSFPLQDNTGSFIGVADVIVDRTPRVVAQNLQILVSILMVTASLVVGAIGLSIIAGRALEPIGTLTASAGAIAAGDLNLSVPVESRDEIGQLASNFNSMTKQLRELFGDMEQRVENRTRDLERRSLQIQTASEIARDITTMQQLDEVLENAVNLIRQRFGHYYVAIFLVDEQGEYAHIRANTDEEKYHFVADRQKLKVGEEGIVGYVTAKGKARTAQDVGMDSYYYRDPLLEETRSEVVLPLRVGSRIIGALDVESTVENAFDEEDVTILQTLADQLAIAIENTRLLEKLQATIKETSVYHQKQLRETWSLSSLDQTQNAYEYDQLHVAPFQSSIPAEILEKLQAGKAVVQKAGHGANQDSNPTLLVPLMLRGQVIGVIGLEETKTNHEWSADEIAIVEAAADQAALTLENARLLQETRRRVQQEQFIGSVTARVRETLDLDTVLQTAIREIGSALDLAEVEVRIGAGLDLEGLGQNQEGR